MARTTATMTVNVAPARRPEPGLTKRQAAICLSEPPPGGPGKGGSERQTHSQAEMHSKGMVFLAKTELVNPGRGASFATLCD